MATNQKKQRKCRLIAKLYTYTRLGFPRGVRSWKIKWPSCAVIFGGRDTVLLRSFASSSLDIFAGRCGVVACRFRSLSISPSLSCSIARCDRESQFIIATRQRRIYTYENMSIKGKCRNRSDSNAVPRSWTLLPS